MPTLHPSIYGGIADHECVEASWDAQADLESSLLNDMKTVFATYDQRKYFDSFDHMFTRTDSTGQGGRLSVHALPVRS